MARDVDLVARLVDKTGPGLRNIQSGINRLGSGTRSLNASTALLGGTYAAVGVAAVRMGADAVSAFAQFDRKVREILTLTGNFSNEALANVGDAATRIARETGQQTQFILQGMYDAVSAGIDESELETFILQAADLATAANTDVATSTGLLTTAVNAYGLAASDATKVSDQMFATVRLGTTTIDQLSRSMFNVAPIAAELGLSIAEVNGWIVQLTLQGTPTAQATTMIRQALVELLKPGTDAFELFEQAAGKTFPEYIAQGGSMADANKILQKAMEDANTSSAELFGSVEAANAVLGIGGEKATAYAESVEEINKSAGETADAVEFMEEGTAAAWDRFMEDVRNVRRVAGQQIGNIHKDTVWALGNIRDAYDFVFNPALLSSRRQIAENEEATKALDKAYQELEPRIHSIGHAWQMYQDEADAAAESADALGLAFEGVAGPLDYLNDIAPGAVDWIYTISQAQLAAAESAAAWQAAYTGPILGDQGLASLPQFSFIPEPERERELNYVPAISRIPGSGELVYTGRTQRRGSSSGGGGSRGLSPEEQQARIEQRIADQIEAAYAGNRISEEMFEALSSSGDILAAIEQQVKDEADRREINAELAGMELRNTLEDIAKREIKAIKDVKAEIAETSAKERALVEESIQDARRAHQEAQEDRATRFDRSIEDLRTDWLRTSSSQERQDIEKRMRRLREDFADDTEDASDKLADRLEDLNKKMELIAENERELVERETQRIVDAADRERSAAEREAEALLDTLNENSDEHLSVLESLGKTLHSTGQVTADELRNVIASIEALPSDLAKAQKESVRKISPVDSTGRIKRPSSITSYEEYQAVQEYSETLDNWEAHMPDLSPEEYKRYQEQLAKYPVYQNGGQNSPITVENRVFLDGRELSAWNLEDTNNHIRRGSIDV